MEITYWTLKIFYIIFIINQPKSDVYVKTIWKYFNSTHGFNAYDFELVML